MLGPRATTAARDETPSSCGFCRGHRLVLLRRALPARAHETLARGANVVAKSGSIPDPRCRGWRPGHCGCAIFLARGDQTMVRLTREVLHSRTPFGCSSAELVRDAPRAALARVCRIGARRAMRWKTRPLQGTTSATGRPPCLKRKRDSEHNAIRPREKRRPRKLGNTSAKRFTMCERASTEPGRRSRRSPSDCPRHVALALRSRSRDRRRPPRARVARPAETARAVDVLRRAVRQRAVRQGDAREPREEL
jgi:hypothetical protein